MNRDPLVTLPPALTGPAPPARAGARYVLGIDGGATKTLAAVLDLDRRVLHLGHGGPSNEDAVGARLAVKAVLDATDRALALAGIAQGELSGAVLAVAGTDTDSIDRHLHDSRSEEWIVVNDVVGAWATATGAQPGVGVISGTGSNVFGVGWAPSPEGWVGRGAPLTPRRTCRWMCVSRRPSPPPPPRWRLWSRWRTSRSRWPRPARRCRA